MMMTHLFSLGACFPKLWDVRCKAGPVGLLLGYGRNFADSCLMAFGAILGTLTAFFLSFLTYVWPWLGIWWSGENTD